MPGEDYIKEIDGNIDGEIGVYAKNLKSGQVIISRGTPELANLFDQVFLKHYFRLFEITDL